MAESGIAIIIFAAGIQIIGISPKKPIMLTNRSYLLLSMLALLGPAEKSAALNRTNGGGFAANKIRTTFNS